MSPLRERERRIGERRALLDLRQRRAELPRVPGDDGAARSSDEEQLGPRLR